jgi:biopolymer transport protein ExbD
MITPHSSDSESDYGFQIAPMVDVVFVLLLFFMALAGLRQIETQIEQELPLPGAGSHEVPLIIDIAANGAVRCNGLELAGAGEKDVSKLLGWLKKVAQDDPKTPVIVRPSGDAEHERFINVLSSLQSAGLKKVSFS